MLDILQQDIWQTWYMPQLCASRYADVRHGSALTIMHVICRRMENAQHKNPQQALRSFDGSLAAGVEALKGSGRWDSILQAGGSSREMLGRPSPPVQVLSRPLHTEETAPHLHHSEGNFFSCEGRLCAADMGLESPVATRNVAYLLPVNVSSCLMHYHLPLALPTGHSWRRLPLLPFQ